MNERTHWRLNWRRSNATAPRRNRAREAKVNPPWEADDFRDMTVAEDFDDRLDDYITNKYQGEIDEQH